jgi:hypothetical protein
VKDASDAAAFSPADLDQVNRLALWLEASSANVVISNNVVGVWKDKSKNKNDASNPNDGPTVQPAILAGHDALRFATHGLVLTIPDATSLQFGTDQIYVAAVTKAALSGGFLFSKAVTTFSTSGPAYQSGFELFVSSGTGDGGATILFPAARIDAQTGNQISWGDSALEDAKFHVVAFRRTTSSQMALTVDDQAPRTAPSGSFSLSEIGQQVQVGNVIYGNTAFPVDFTIAEIVVVHDPLTGVVADTDVAALHAYLKQKYGL